MMMLTAMVMGALPEQHHQAGSPRKQRRQDERSAEDAGRIPSVELITSGEESE